MLASNLSANQVPYGTGGFALGRPPVLQFAVGKKAKNAFYNTGKTHRAPTNFLGGEPNIKTFVIFVFFRVIRVLFVF